MLGKEAGGGEPPQMLLRRHVRSELKESIDVLG